MGLKDGEGKGRVEDIPDRKNSKYRHWAGLQRADWEADWEVDWG